MEKTILPLYINGEFIRKSPQFDNFSPVTGKLVNTVTYADRTDVDSAVAAARAALHGPWGEMTPEQRSALLNKLATAIEARFEDFVAAEVQDTGRPLPIARSLDVSRAIANFRTFADMTKTSVSTSCITYNADGSQLINYTVRKPLGVIAVISPWNLPLLLIDFLFV